MPKTKSKKESSTGSNFDENIEKDKLYDLYLLNPAGFHFICNGLGLKELLLGGIVSPMYKDEAFIIDNVTKKKESVNEFMSKYNWQ